MTEKIIGDETPITCRPADLIAPQLPQFEKECAQWKQQDEDVLSYALFPAVAKDFFEYRLPSRPRWTALWLIRRVRLILCKWDKGCNRGKYEITDDDMYAKAVSGWGQAFPDNRGHVPPELK